MLCFYYSFAQMCSLIENVSHVSDVAYGPLVEYFTFYEIYEF